MTKVIPIALAASALALGGCATTSEESDRFAGKCDPEAGQAFVGQQATADVGAMALKATSSSILRWGPPRSAMTMDYRIDRLTISYDDNMKIDRVACG